MCRKGNQLICKAMRDELWAHGIRRNQEMRKEIDARGGCWFIELQLTKPQGRIRVSG